jgi:hypothetical protein
MLRVGNAIHDRAGYRGSVLERLDDMDWSAYDGAYGRCGEAGEILRAIGSPDSQVAGEGRYAFASSLWHQPAWPPG